MPELKDGDVLRAAVQPEHFLVLYTEERRTVHQREIYTSVDYTITALCTTEYQPSSSLNRK